jgi:hypothetical protein
VANQRVAPVAESTAAPAAPSAEASAEFLVRWGKAWSRAERGTYTPTPEDRAVVMTLLGLAQEAATQHGNGDAAFATRVVAHWIDSYLDDDGVNGHLAKARHPLRLMVKQVATYGLPKERRRAALAAVERADERVVSEIERRANADAARALAASLAAGRAPGIAAARPRDAGRDGAEACSG